MVTKLPIGSLSVPVQEEGGETSGLVDSDCIKDILITIKAGYINPPEGARTVGKNKDLLGGVGVHNCKVYCDGRRDEFE